LRFQVSLALALAAPLTLAACGSTDSAAADPGDDAAGQGTGGSPTADAGNGGSAAGGSTADTGPQTGGEPQMADAGPPCPTCRPRSGTRARRLARV
jgi:hypothetical protein